MMTGRYFNGLLLGEGGLRVWPEHVGGKLAGWLELDLSAPSGTAPLPFRVELPDGHSSEHRIRGGGSRRSGMPVCAAGVWKAPFAAGPSHSPTGRGSGSARRSPAWSTTPPPALRPICAGTG